MKCAGDRYSQQSEHPHKGRMRGGGAGEKEGCGARLLIKNRCMPGEKAATRRTGRRRANTETACLQAYGFQLTVNWTKSVLISVPASTEVPVNTRLLLEFGFGVPSLDRALSSANRIRQ